MRPIRVEISVIVHSMVKVTESKRTRPQRHRTRHETAMKRNPQIKQRGMFCPCGRSEILALGLCSSCYSMKRQDEEITVASVKPFWIGQLWSERR